jgi:hypothetical protein
MEITGTVRRVCYTATSYGSVRASVDIDESRFRYLHTFQPRVSVGDKITLAGVPLVGYRRLNVGAVQITIHGGQT